jgi:flagellum-specific ATP synthase
MSDDFYGNLAGEIDRIGEMKLFGRVVGVRGLLVECVGLQGVLGVGGRCAVATGNGESVMCEAVGFRDDRALLMPFEALEGVALGARVDALEREPAIRPNRGWLGRVINARGEDIDGKGPLGVGRDAYPMRNPPPPAHARARTGAKVDLGVRVLNTFTTCCRGQRIGIFAASGVGKSVLLSMMARYTSADVIVIGLVGERGREVQEFLQDHLGAEGLARSVVVVATSDESALMRRQAAYVTLACAEYFRDQGADVLCLMDSVTRFAMAQREIGLAAGEPPATKGYTPSVFSELPRLLERAGPGIDSGTITGLFTVLVDGDVVMERAIAERGRFPAVNVLRSISRTMPACNSEAENDLVFRARGMMATYSEMEDMIRLGAYRKGSDPQVDAAIHYHDALESFLAQDIVEKCDLAEGYQQLDSILAGPAPPALEGNLE